ncbi:Hypothetical protein, putative [Bodo saltans]|uniref:Uncharacterized protein n=1 Tax=Bodo saltans TaxID=75058 RepID=A0A0S4JED0_BODSA|nr:Hypothetical protein, putative [Bodo saltans]|eukprot:CUG89942.1 Hypothetical protein, putative [Bodo saltans]
MPLTPVDFVPEVGAYRQRIEKELRTLRPKTSQYYPVVGPYAIPDRLPPDLQRLLDEQNGISPSHSPARKGHQSRLKNAPETAEKLRHLEEQILEEREGRRQVEEQIDRLQVMLQKLVIKEGPK